MDREDEIDTESGAEQPEKGPIRTCAVHLKSILRADLPDQPFF